VSFLGTIAAVALALALIAEFVCLGFGCAVWFAGRRLHGRK